MIFYRISTLALVLVASLAPVAAVAQLSAPDPMNPQATTPTVPYQSAFAEYQVFQEPPLKPWLTANDEVRETGSMAEMQGMKGMHDMQYIHKNMKDIHKMPAPLPKNMKDIHKMPTPLPASALPPDLNSKNKQ